MIRFSAALVAVAIGVLIGGIATSKLLLVYIAIVVSAVALVVLAIGVVLKREELFGERQGIVPAGAGAAPVLPARAGESQAQPRQDVSSPPSAPFAGATAGLGSAFAGTAFEGAAFDGGTVGGTAQAVPPATAAGPPAPYQAVAGPGRDRVAGQVPSWEAQSARDQWSSSPRSGSTAVDPAPDWMPGGRAANDPPGQAGQAAPAASMPSRTPPAPSGARPEPAPPSWFNKLAQPAEVSQTVPAGTAAAADEDPGDDDDDWPTRYSWLDDEPEESDAGQSSVEPEESGPPAGRADDVDDAEDADDVKDAEDVQDPEVPAEAASAPVRSGQDLAEVPTATGAPANNTAASDATSPDVPAAPAATGTKPEWADPEAEPAEPEAEPAEPEAELAEPEAELAEPEAELAESEAEPAEPEAEPEGGGQPSADEDGPAPAAGTVAVLRGVPRYHQPDCVLIRFLPDGDIQRLPVAQAKADGCTPCAACQPAE